MLKVKETSKVLEFNNIELNNMNYVIIST